MAGHLGLGKLIVLYDDNDVQLDGPTSMAFSDDTTKRFEAYGWQVLEVTDGNTDPDAIEAAIRAGQAETGKPTLIRVKTIIGYGLPKQGSSPDVHGKAPSLDDVIAAKKGFGWDNLTPFWSPPEGLNAWAEAGAKGASLEAEWNEKFAAYQMAENALGIELTGIFSKMIPALSRDEFPIFDPAKPVRTRNASQAIINAIAPRVPELLGGSADLSSSNMTHFKGSGAMSKDAMGERNINFGVREHAMAAIGNGMTLSGLRPYVATFFTFSDYMKNSVRLAALMGIPTIFLYTHDSIGVGTDGPTHQPVEHLAGLRAIPHLHVIRPADANESNVAWKLALERTDGPTALVFTRQDVPVLPVNWEGASRGGYVISDCEGTPEVILIGTGSEVQLAIGAKTELEKQGIKARAVSLPSFEIFCRSGRRLPRKRAARRRARPRRHRSRFIFWLGTLGGLRRQDRDRQ